MVPLPLPAAAEVSPPLPPPQAARATRGRTRARPVQAVRRYLLLVELMLRASVRCEGSWCAGAFRRWGNGVSGGFRAAEGLLGSARARRCGCLAQDETDGHLHMP